jgi:hypothetical protein
MRVGEMCKFRQGTVDPSMLPIVRTHPCSKSSQMIPATADTGPMTSRFFNAKG